MSDQEITLNAADGPATLDISSFADELDVDEEDRKKNAEWLRQALSEEDTVFPLEVDGRDVSDVIDGGPRLELEFRSVAPEKVDKFFGSFESSYQDPHTSLRMSRQSIWGAVRVLVEEKMLVRAVLPHVKDGKLTAVEISTENPRHALTSMKGIVRTLSLMAAIVRTAVEFYSGGADVVEDLGN